MEEASDIMSDKTKMIKDADLIFAMGIRFWSKLVISECIMNVEKCSQVLETLNSVIESKQTYGTIISSPETIEIAENYSITSIQENEAEYVIFPNDEEFPSLFWSPITHLTLNKTTDSVT
jgi:hypothetical protein